MVYNQQPGAVPQMSINRNVLNKPYNHNNERPWSHGLFTCFGDCSTCFVSWLCPCIIWSQNKSRLEYLEHTGQPHPDGGESFGNDCLIHGVLTACGGLGWVLQIGTRTSTRERYRIEGNPVKDCFASWCCHACELTQESRELELEETNLRENRMQSMMREHDMPGQDSPPHVDLPVPPKAYKA
ncbi:hypothetical protein EIP91_011257 [Steccherinum ochraceum]|uniref:PLAC8-domain-containing protein n=1 Tax=Steccherinum ochraceum TaxID=92696 RepID=A0A4R0QZX0_9APHY|nr:hypothetical protein EIP91_011257 [Steccherinum ochraceum]